MANHVVINGIESKKCKDCGEVFPLDGFYKNKTCNGGYKHSCKECDRHVERNRHYLRERLPKPPRLPHYNVDGVESKGCRGCKAILPLWAFNVNNESVDKLHGECRRCRNTNRVDKRVALGKARRYSRMGPPIAKEVAKRKRKDALFGPHRGGKCRGLKNPHTFVSGVEHKRCGRCKEYKPIKNFGNFKPAPDGLNRICRSCAGDNQRAYQKKHRRRAQDKQNIYTKNPTIAKARRLRNIVRSSLTRRGKVKSKETETLLGCTIEQAKMYLELEYFTQYGEFPQDLWKGLHIDHIKPVSLFSLEDLEESCRIYNLRLLPGAENESRLNEYTEKDEILFEQRRILDMMRHLNNESPKL